MTTDDYGLVRRRSSSVRFSAGLFHRFPFLREKTRRAWRRWRLNPARRRRESGDAPSLGLLALLPEEILFHVFVLVGPGEWRRYARPLSRSLVLLSDEGRFRDAARKWAMPLFTRVMRGWAGNETSPLFVMGEQMGWVLQHGGNGAFGAFSQEQLRDLRLAAQAGLTTARAVLLLSIPSLRICRANLNRGLRLLQAEIDARGSETAASGGECQWCTFLLGFCKCEWADLLSYEHIYHGWHLRSDAWGDLDLEWGIIQYFAFPSPDAGGRRLYREAVEHGNEHALCALLQHSLSFVCKRRMFLSWKLSGSRRRSATRALKLIERGMELGLRAAFACFGLFAEYGVLGVEMNLDEALVCYERALALGPLVARDFLLVFTLAEEVCRLCGHFDVGRRVLLAVRARTLRATIAERDAAPAEE